MYKHILIATDGSALAAHAIDHGLALAKDVGARVTAVTVTELWSPSEMASRASRGEYHAAEAYETHASEQASKILGAAKAAAEKAGVKCDTLHVPDARPADGIVRAAQEQGCDLIVMATHGRRGISRLVLGSQAAEVLAATTVPVLIAK